MRHDDSKTTREHYISRNTYLEKIKLKESVSRKKASNEDAYSAVEIEAFLAWMKISKRVPGEIIDNVRQIIFTQNAIEEAKDKAPEKVDDFAVTEYEVLKRLDIFSIKVKGLRDYCLEKGYALRLKDELFVYSESFVQYLLDEFTTSGEIMDKLCITKMTIHNNPQIFTKLTIGKALLVKKQGISEYILKGGRKF
jgi:hypothetical protein